ncbi:MAG: DUF2330 domain-containing protein [Deltaproteobacteria bacterium]|nr:DUF2330 domain-containing protein [Deltaproteobacteria bacterium]
MMARFALAFAALLALTAPRPADAFCGFYVSGAGADMYNNATVVVLMREGTRTVLSMQNNYQGPPSDFAMVVPVPVVVQKDNVKTLPNEVFGRVDQMAAPRLVEYWEMDPCRPQYKSVPRSAIANEAPSSMDDESAADKDYGVKIEAQFDVAEYNVVVLSARDSTGLDAWLRKENYKIPAQAERLLKPYVVSGMKFFVAKVDTKKVKFVNGQAMLSPLRVHYDSDQFNLPIRLGLVNSSGKQDLLVHILAPNQRYEVANYKNVTIPTNLTVREATKKSFAAFYNSLFDSTLREHGPAVVTEYSWNASTCDPCPGATLTGSDFMTLGADVLPSQGGSGFVLTRLHARYSANVIGDDLVFRKAEPIIGGRGTPDTKGRMERGVKKSSVNNFQGRYVILHRWKGSVECANPQLGQWGGPPGGQSQLQAAKGLAFAPRNQKPETYLESAVSDDDTLVSGSDDSKFVGPTGVAPPLEKEDLPTSPGQSQGRGCAGCQSSQLAGAGAGLGLLVLLLLVRRRSWNRRAS